MSNIIISPSILAADFANLQKEIEKVEKAGANWIHVDVMDGHFVPNITIGIPVVKSIRKITKMPLDVHLMIENPFEFIPAFIDAGSDIITVHYETCSDIVDEIIDYVKIRNVKIGLSIKPKTPAQTIEKYFDKLDMVLVMTVEPGFSGQAFIEEAAYKIEYIKNKAPESLIIQADGGINDKTAQICKMLGANALVAGNFVYKSSDISQAVASLRA